MDRKLFRKTLEFAVQNEAEAQRFYRRAAEVTSNGALRSLFRELSKEEAKHKAMIERFLANQEMEIRFDRVPDRLLPSRPGPFPSAEMAIADALRLAMKKEEEAKDLYTGLAKGCDDPEERKVFLDLAAMEMGHRQMLENAYSDAGFPTEW
ncbi:MAG: ferritin family protein [Candidatus Eisenbacteria bacterium]|nr:ferritin family protein [Candidatus Eisenbacteria bacterium]